MGYWPAATRVVVGARSPRWPPFCDEDAAPMIVFFLSGSFFFLEKVTTVRFQVRLFVFLFVWKL
jgi:hypothetical protein